MSTLVAFDFDGALSRTDMSVLLGEEKDVANEVRGLVEQGRRGEVEFGVSLRQQVELFDGLSDARVAAAFERIRLRDGAGDLLGDLRGANHHVAVISGSFRRGIETALERERVAPDTIVANRLVIENGAVTGEVDGPLVEGGKDEALDRLAVTEGIDLGRTVVVGNGATDLPMLKVAGTAIGFDPVPVVEPHCDVVVHSLRRLRLYFDQHGMLEPGEGD